MDALPGEWLDAYIESLENFLEVYPDGLPAEVATTQISYLQGNFAQSIRQTENFLEYLESEGFVPPDDKGKPGKPDKPKKEKKLKKVK